jgi:hypothetical protein
MGVDSLQEAQLAAVINVALTEMTYIRTKTKGLMGTRLVVVVVVVFVVVVDVVFVVFVVVVFVVVVFVVFVVFVVVVVVVVVVCVYVFVCRMREDIL